MNKLFTALLVILVTFSFSTTAEARKQKKASGKALGFEAAAFDTPEKIAEQGKKLIDVSGGKYLKKYNVKKIGIMEFYVEFLQSREVQESTFDAMHGSDVSRVFGPQTVRKESLKFSGDYYKDAVAMMYEIIATELAKSGFEVIPKDEMGNDPAYKKLELATEVEGGGYKGGVYQQGVTTQTVKLSVDGLGLLPEHMGVGGIMAAMKKNNDIKAFKGKTAKDKGLDAMAQIYIFVDKGEDGVPLINSFNIIFDVGPDNDPNYPYFKEEKGTRINLEKPLVSEADIGGTGKNSIDATKYNTALFEMVGAIAKMSGAAMAAAMK